MELKQKSGFLTNTSSKNPTQKNFLFEKKRMQPILIIEDEYFDKNS